MLKEAKNEDLEALPELIHNLKTWLLLKHWKVSPTVSTNAMIFLTFSY